MSRCIESSQGLKEAILEDLALERSRQDARRHQQRTVTMTREQWQIVDEFFVNAFEDKHWNEDGTLKVGEWEAIKVKLHEAAFEPK